MSHFIQTSLRTTLKFRIKTVQIALFLCCLLGTLHINNSLAEEFTQEILVTGVREVTSPLNLTVGSGFAVTFDDLKIEGVLAIEGAGFSETFSSEDGTVEAGPYLVTLEPGEYILTETYMANVGSSSSLLPIPDFDTPVVTFSRPISVDLPTTCTLEIHTFISDLRIGIEGPFAASEESIPGVIGSEITLNLVVTTPIGQGETFEYLGNFSATVVSDTSIAGKVASSPEVEPPPDPDEEEMPAQDISDENGDTLTDEKPGKPPGKEDTPSEGSGRPEDMPDESGEGPNDEKPGKPSGKDDTPGSGRGRPVERQADGVLDFGPMTLSLPLATVSNQPVVVTARLQGTWAGRGMRVMTPSGVVNQTIQVDTFDGFMELSHELEGLPTPIIVGLQGEKGSVTQHRRSPESPVDVFLRVQAIGLTDFATGAPVAWPEDLLGPLPNQIKIKDGQLQFAKSTGRLRDLEVEVEDATAAAEQAAAQAEQDASEAINQPIRAAQGLARKAAANARKAAREAEKAEQAAERAAEEAAQSGNEADLVEATQAEATAERARAAAERAEKAAKAAGKAATDLNDDGKNNIFDLVIVVPAFGRVIISPEDEGAASDINGDGVVNILDLVLVAHGLGDGALIPGGEEEEEEVAAPPGVAAMPSKVVWLEINPQRVNFADNGVRVDLMTDGVQGLYAFQFELSFDGEILEVVNVAEGSLLGNDGAETYWYAPNVRKSQVIRVASTRLAPEGISEAGVLAVVTFRLKTDAWRVTNPIRTGTVTLSDAKGSLIESARGMKGLDFEKAFLPRRPELLQNYPNPFNPETWIPYQLTEPATVIIRIYDTMGQRVRTLNLGLKTGGFYLERDKAAYWDGRNQSGETVASGVYFYSIEAESFSDTKKLLILK